MGKTILHVAAIELSRTGGMARISSSWRDAFLRAGCDFHHLGPQEVKPGMHHSLFGLEAKKFIKKNKPAFDMILAHEPTAGFLKFAGVPLVVFSHGIEERAWELNRSQHFFPVSGKSALFPDFLRFYSHRRGFKRSDLVLLSNHTDQAYLKNKGITHTAVFKNGYTSFAETGRNEFQPVFLYNGTWILRKGIKVLAEAFNRVFRERPDARLILAGTGRPEVEVLRGFDREWHSRIQVVPSFSEEEEAMLYRDAHIFVLPSYFEGQSLALTQAMAMGLCPVVSDNCGQIDVVADGANGRWFKTGHAGSLASVLLELLSAPQKVAKMASAARESVSDRTWPAVADEVVTACKKLLD